MEPLPIHKVREGLERLSKDRLVTLCKQLYIPTGDYARTTKQEFVDRIAAVYAGMDDWAQAVIHEALGEVPAPQQEQRHMEQQPQQSAPAQNDAAAQLVAAVRALSSASADEATVRRIVQEQIDALASRIEPRVVHHVLRDPDTVTMDEHMHPLFPKALRLVNAGLPVMLVGPAGCGKTHLASQIARALGVSFGSISMTAGVSESQLVGWLLPVGEAGRFDYVPAPFVSLYESGNSLFLFDEVDAADPNLLLVLNSAIANGELSVPQRHSAPVVKRGDRALLMASANTYGTGADMVYAGRSALDGATLDRWYQLRMDYDARFEASIAGTSAPHVPEWRPADEATVAADCAVLGDWVLSLRRKVNEAKLRRIVSTRTMQKAITARCAGVPVAEVKADTLAGWSTDELYRVGEAA